MEHPTDPPSPTTSPPAFGTTVSAQRLGRPPLVEHDRVVAAAVEVGFDALTVTAVAERMGVGLSTLYRLFPSRTALAADAVEQVLVNSHWPSPPIQPAEGWRSYLSETIWTAWNLYDRYPGLAAEVASLAFASPTLASVNQRTVTVLLDAGFAPQDALLIMDIAGELALGPFLLARDLAAVPAPERDRDAGGDRPTGLLDRIAVQRRALMPPSPQDSDTEYDPIRDVIVRVVWEDPRHWLQAKLEFFLDGASTRLGSGSRPVQG